MPDWRQAIRERLPDANESVVEELAQHLEARFEELESYDAVMSEWSVTELRAELVRLQRRKEPPQPGNPTSGLWQDVRYGLRQLRLNPGFAAVAILSLALGIGANTAIFQLLNAVRLRSLPVAQPQELVNVRFASIRNTSGSFRGTFGQSTYAMWQEVRKQSQGFSGMFAWGSDSFDLATGGEKRYTRGALWVSGEFFQVLGVHAERGRVFTAADDPSGPQGCRAPGMVISHAFWQREFGGDPAIVGRKITLNRMPVEIIGVTQPGFYGVEVGRSYDLALPLCASKLLRFGASTLRVEGFCSGANHARQCLVAGHHGPLEAGLDRRANLGATGGSLSRHSASFGLREVERQKYKRLPRSAPGRISRRGRTLRIARRI